MNSIQEGASVSIPAHLENDLPFVLSAHSVGILRALSRLRTSQFRRVRPLCLHISAAAGSGKTRLLRHYMSQLVGDPGANGLRHREVVLVEAPYDGNCMKLCGSIIHACLPGFPLRNARIVHEKLADILMTSGVKQVLIDEAGNILNAGRAGQQHTLAMIKFICNLGITVGIATTKNMVNVLSADEQLASRFKHIEIPVWKETTEFRQFLAGIEGALKLPAASQLDSQTIIRWLITHDCCVTSQLVELLIRAARLVHIKGRDRITVDILDEALKIGWAGSMEAANDG